MLTADYLRGGGIPEVHILQKGAAVKLGLEELRMRETNGGIQERPLWYTCSRRYRVREPTCEKTRMSMLKTQPSGKRLTFLEIVPLCS